MPAVPPYLYVIGGLVLRTPTGLNPQDVTEEFGGDYAVKPVVGARVKREAVGPADNRLIFTGTIFPFRFAAAGGSSGQSEIDLLRSYAEQQTPLPITRSDLVVLPGYWLVEKGTIHHSKLAKQGIGRVQEFSFSMVRTDQGPSPAAAVQLYAQAITLLTTVVGASALTSSSPAAPVTPPFGPPPTSFNT